jgi:hypothetical protein
VRFGAVGSQGVILFSGRPAGHCLCLRTVSEITELGTKIAKNFRVQFLPLDLRRSPGTTVVYHHLRLSQRRREPQLDDRGDGKYLVKPFRLEPLEYRLDIGSRVDVWADNTDGRLDFL